MVHDIRTLASATGSGWCREHGGDSHTCGASKEAKGLLIVGLALVAIIGAIVAWVLMED